MNKMIEFLKDTYGNSTGDVVNVINETEGEVYYIDTFKRHCFLPMSERGITWEFKNDERGPFSRGVTGRAERAYYKSDPPF